MLKKTNDTKIIILGGLGEIGKNMYCVMHGDEIIIIDSGISFPEDSLLGIDYVLPDVTFLKQNQDKIKALIITHGHEDHIGGIPYLVQTLNIPAIYAPNQAKELIALKLQDKNIRYDNLFVYNDQTVLKFKKITVEFFRTTHSIPDSHGILVKTPDGNIVTTGDFKFDFTPIGPMADLHKMARIGEEGVDLLISDSTNALNEGISISETKVDNALNDIFDKETIESCIHFAGLKAVGESVVKPWEYYENNIAGTLTLVDVMRKNNVKNIIFSSSATVYGDPAQIPITEECPKGQCTNPYGWTKSMLEQVLTDIQKADPEWNVMLLRYFNPIGAHKSGTIGENPNGIPNNLMPYITQVAVGKLKELGVFGNDYDTPDGTGVRDYIHVVDLAKGHVKALKKIEENPGLAIYNLGTGKGYSVLDIVKNFEAATGVKIPYVIKPRRAGDIATCYCDASKAEKELGWKAENGIREMCEDSWRWQSNNPQGYEE
mgnify:CR=1 FL=1